MKDVTRKTLSIKSLLLFWLPPVIWAAGIFYISSGTTASVSTVYAADFVAKKSAHIFEYAILGILIYRAFINSGINKKQAVIFSVMICFIYGSTDEFHQFFTPGREPRMRDIIIDTIGATIGTLTVWKLLPKAPKTLKNLAEKLDLV